MPVAHQGAVRTGIEQCNGKASVAIRAGIQESGTGAAILLACAVASTSLGVYAHTGMAEQGQHHFEAPCCAGPHEWRKTRRTADVNVAARGQQRFCGNHAVPCCVVQSRPCISFSPRLLLTVCIYSLQDGAHNSRTITAAAIAPRTTDAR